MRLIFEALDLGFELLSSEPVGPARKQLGHFRIVTDGIGDDDPIVQRDRDAGTVMQSGFECQRRRAVS